MAAGESRGRSPGLDIVVEVGGRAGGAPPSAPGLRVNRGPDGMLAQGKHRPLTWARRKASRHSRPPRTPASPNCTATNGRPFAAYADGTPDTDRQSSPSAGVEGVEDAARFGEHRPVADRRAFSSGDWRTGRQLHRSRGA